MDWLKYNYWLDAIELIEYETSKINKNKHFNTIDLMNYSSINVKDKTQIKSKEFFDSFISNRMFFGMEESVYNFFYNLPKNDHSYRKMSFMSYIARIIHTAIGLYLNKLTADFNDKFFNDRIISKYGGLIKYDNDVLKLNDHNVYYRDSYNSFLKQLTSKILVNNKNREHFVIKLDVQNYYDSINNEIFLTELYNKISFINKETYNFTPNTINDICDFYKLIMKANNGFPQCNNDISGNFISSLYMKLVDLEIFESINRTIDKKADCSIIQYCDDTYISIFLEDSNNMDLIKKLLLDISYNIYTKFKLRFNDKSIIMSVSDDTKEDVLKVIKYNSLSETILYDDDPNIIFDSVIKQLDQINSFDSNQDEFVLGYIFDNKVKSVIHKEDNLKLLESVFMRLNFDRFIQYSKYIVALCDNTDAMRSCFLKYLEEYNDNKFSYYIEYYTKIDSTIYNKIYRKIEREDYKKIFEAINDNAISTNCYLHLKNKEFLNLNVEKNKSYISQVVKRRISEENENYNESLNHLINEIHFILYNRFSYCNSRLAKYNANSIIKDISNMNPNDKIKIMNAFDRRNNNQISHTTGEIVLKKEYYEIKNDIINFVRIFYNNYYLYYGKNIHIILEILNKINNSKHVNSNKKEEYQTNITYLYANDSRININLLEEMLNELKLDDHLKKSINNEVKKIM